MKILSYITVALMLLQAAVARAETITSGNIQYEIVEFMGYDEEEAVVVGLAEGFVPLGPAGLPVNGKIQRKECQSRRHRLVESRRPRR